MRDTDEEMRGVWRGEVKENGDRNNDIALHVHWLLSYFERAVVCVYIATILRFSLRFFGSNCNFYTSISYSDYSLLQRLTLLSHAANYHHSASLVVIELLVTYCSPLRYVKS